MDSRSRFWCFTSYDVATEPLSEHRDKCSYIVWGREICPSTNRQHLQGFVAFRTRTKFSTIKRWLPGAHIEKCKGTPDENARYCKKDGDFKEFGVLPKDTTSGGPFARALQLARENKLHEVEQTQPGIFLRYKNTLESLITFRTSEMNNSCGIWIYGPPRCGKDFAVHQSPSLYVKALNKWWDGYKGEEDVLISDVDKESKWLGQFLKIWADRYKFRAEIKGGTMYIRPKRIYVTSNYSIREIFEDKVADAISARFNVYNFYVTPYEFIPRQESIPPTQVLDALIQRGDINKGGDEVDYHATTSTTPTDAEKEAASSANKENIPTSTTSIHESSDASEDDFQGPCHLQTNCIQRSCNKKKLGPRKRPKMVLQHRELNNG